MGVYLVGLAGILVFYLLVLVVGIWASTKQKNHGEEEIMLAGRSLGLVVGVLTLIATWVGGGYINGTAEVIFSRGLAWCQVPIGYSLSLIFGGLLFVKPMREANYVTMLDPFQLKYGNRVGGLLFLPALCGDLFWCAAVLSSLGTSLMVIMDLDMTVSIVTSATFAAAYTVVGGMYSVSYTDVLQLGCITLGLVVSAPFAYYHPQVSHQAMVNSSWLGHVEKNDIGIWLDGLLLLIFGGIPWQGYFQRVLAIRTTKMAQQTAFWSMVGCLLMGIPALLFGVIALGTDWTHVEGFNRNMTLNDANVILPRVLRHLTPHWVSFFGLGSVSAAVMSSADSSILASAAMFTRNIYKWTFRPTASEKEVMWIMRLATIVISYLSAAIAISVGSIYYLSYLCSDLVYVILFPQLLLVVHWSRGVTTYGCLASYAVGLTLRVLGGEKDIGLDPVISYPYFDSETNTQRFPFRTLAMVCAIVTHVVVSAVTRWLFESGTLSADRWDILMAFPDCHLTRTEHREQRYKDPNKGRTNKALHDAMVGKRLSQASEGLLSGNDDDSLLMKRDRSELTNQASVSSETPSVSKF
ncbi:high-affinity choline transporter 1-like [Macrosteles quadrilineatus]|uniref:high-affinity choline transporter 1-like n=1 Tax=Macrosteles quadrilineatus TaxID=74068 RepID=UPI0023E31DE8|nr:high-affinity choline transporter 1-like [Macrosteles quadrilineatus]XP_054269322.1 high-affinity choline transporter 1-like [Macrosteles quadrilineatus]